MASDKRGMEREIRRKWRADRVYHDKASPEGNYAKVMRLLEAQKTLLKTFILSLWSEEDAKILQAHKRE